MLGAAPSFTAGFSENGNIHDDDHLNHAKNDDIVILMVMIISITIVSIIIIPINTHNNDDRYEHGLRCSLQPMLGLPFQH